MSLLSKNLQQLNAGSGYKFSATKIDKLGATQYTLATIVMDTSTSVESYAPQLETALKTVFKACEKSPQSNNLMFRLTQFASRLTELHGFKELSSITEKDYDNILQIGGSTALFDAVDEALQATGTYGKQLTSMDFLVNGIVVVVTDGESNTGNINSGDLAADAAVIKKTLQNVRRAENLESLLLILVGVTQDDVNLNMYLQTVKDEGGFDQYVSIGRATPGKIAFLAKFISQSVSSTSSALGSGKASVPLNPSQFTF
jgi:hypothetical protein